MTLYSIFNSNNPDCIYNKPNPGNGLPRYLPGKILNADGQCEKLVGTAAWEVDDTICRRLKCTVDGDIHQWIEIGSAAADGTSCGINKICLHGQCLKIDDIKYS